MRIKASSFEVLNLHRKELQVRIRQNKQTNIGGQDNGNIDGVPSRLKCFLDYSAFKGSPAVDLKRQFIPELQGKAVQCTARLLSYGGTTSKQGERVSKGFRGPATSS